MPAVPAEERPMSDVRPNSVHLTVADPKRSIRFYVEKLGFELRECWPDAKKPMWASLALDGQVVMLGAPPDAAKLAEMGATKAEVRHARKTAKAFKKHRHGVGVALYLAVPDVDAHHRAVRKKRVEVLLEPKTWFYGIRDFTLADPDGYQLVFFMPAPAAELAPAPRKGKKKGSTRDDMPATTPAPASRIDVTLALEPATTTAE
jgi:uncharacterized glyoxalase superfamily protein PhnB